MNKKVIAGFLLVAIVGLWGNEFTKSARVVRKEKVQQENTYTECVQLIDTLIERLCVAHTQCAEMISSLYAQLRSCAVDEKPDLAGQDVAVLKAKLQWLQSLEKQLQMLEKVAEVNPF